ncbi:MAG: homoserine O-succinyltransferase, partial [Clostridia bacterium]
PAFDVLTNENIFVMPHNRAAEQDIRPIEIAIVNLMPTKIATETQLMRLLGNSSLQINVTLINMDSYQGHYTPQSHMDKFYHTFDEIKTRHFDGMLITGAPVEQMPFEQVAYWEELTKIMEFTNTNVTSTMYICWGAQAGLYYHYGIQKRDLDKKLFGIYPCKPCDEHELLLKGMDDVMYIPMSRHTEIDSQAALAEKALKPLAYGDECGISILKTLDNRKFFFTGHSEYDRETLKTEYLRDKEKGLPIQPPTNYFVDGDINQIDMKWRSTANLLYYNWLNYYVYQVTPYSFSKEENS